MVKITISGIPGAGKSLLKKNLAKKLFLSSYSMGDLKGEFAKSKGMTIDEFMAKCPTEEVHHKVDNYQENLGKTEDNFVIDGWMSWYFIPDSIKIFLETDWDTAAKRIFYDKRDYDEPKYSNIKECKKIIEERYWETRRQIMEDGKYGGADFNDKSNYDLLIDTTNLSPEGVVNIILTSLKNLKNFKHRKIPPFKKMYDIFSKEQKIPEKKIIEKQKEIIEVDFREKNSLVPSELIKNGFSVDFKELKVGDYIVKGAAVERKSAKDFFSSVFDKRVFSQLKELTQYEKRLLIIEGNLEKENRMHENALKGLLLSINLNYDVPIIFSKTPEETAKFLSILASKEKKEASINAMKKSLSPEEELLFVLESFPGIGPATGKALLEKFGSLKKILNTKEKNLKPILGKNSGKFVEISERKYYKK